MRSADQIKRKINELSVLKKDVQAKLQTAAEGEAAALADRLDRLEEQLLLLEWVLNEPQGSYHGHS